MLGVARICCEVGGSHGRERGMGAAFVKIGARYINLSAILWVEVQEEKPKQRLMLVYHTFQCDLT